MRGRKSRERERERKRERERERRSHRQTERQTPLICDGHVRLFLNKKYRVWRKVI